MNPRVVEALTMRQATEYGRELDLKIAEERVQGARLALSRAARQWKGVGSANDWMRLTSAARAWVQADRELEQVKARRGA